MLTSSSPRLGSARATIWVQKRRSGSYVADDYADTRLILYDDLFADWETLLKFQIGGRDYPDPTLGEKTDQKA
jgi:hypothetical protein